MLNLKTAIDFCWLNVYLLVGALNADLNNFLQFMYPVKLHFDNGASFLDI